MLNILMNESSITGKSFDDAMGSEYTTTRITTMQREGFCLPVRLRQGQPERGSMTGKESHHDTS